MDEKELLKERFKAAVSSAVKVIAEQFDLDIKFKKGSSLKNSKYIAEHSFLIGNHHLISAKTQNYVIDCITAFLKKKLKSRN